MMAAACARPYVAVSGLRVSARRPDGRDFDIVHDIDFELARGEVLALIGESGSGKTTIALAMLGYARNGAAITGGSIRVGDVDLLSPGAAGLRTLRGNRICYVAQSAAAAFNPARTIMDQAVEAALVHGLMSRAEAEAKAVGLFGELGLPRPESIGRKYPHQFSGGQLQRLMAAMALMSDPDLIILDEPTTALDVTTQIGVLQAFRNVVRRRGTTAIYVSHDLAVVAQMADHILVLQQGHIVEAGTTARMIEAPEQDYTRTLMAAVHPAPIVPERAAATAVPLLEVRGVTAGYGRIDAAGHPAIPVLRDVSLSLWRGRTLGVIGESGSGKSTLARTISGLLPPARGEVLLDGAPLPPGLKGRTRDDFRRVQIVFQNADVALNPAQSVRQILKRPLAFYHGLRGAAAEARIAELLDLIRLPATIGDRRCTELSGGQKQRVNLARALAANPDVVLCDEVTSALDTVVGAAILDLLADLRRDLGIGMIFISHDISTVRAICDDILVLYHGHAVEQGPRDTFAEALHHPYTRLLVSSVPELRIGWLPDAGSAPPLPPVDESRSMAELCPFLARCDARAADLCGAGFPSRHRLPTGNEILCHFTDEKLMPSASRRAGAA